MTSPLVTVVVPTYNRAATLERTLDSVLAQTIRPRIIVVDDCSGDGTEQVCRCYGDAIEYVRNPERLGLFANWNRGLALANGDFVAIFHDDDTYEATMVEKEVAILQTFPNVAMVHTANWIIDDAENTIGSDLGGWPPMMSGEQFRRALAGRFGSPVAAPSVMMRRMAIEAVGGFDESLRVCGDYVAWLEIAKYGDVAYIAEPLMSLRLRGRYANDHAALDWGIIGEQLTVAERAQSEVFGQLTRGFRVRRDLFIGQFVLREIVEPARGDATAVVNRHGSAAEKTVARAVPRLRWCAPLLERARPLAARAIVRYHTRRRHRGYARE